MKNNYYALLIPQTAKGVEKFSSKREAQKFANFHNKEFKKEYNSTDDYLNDLESPEYVVLDELEYSQTRRFNHFKIEAKKGL